MSFSILQTLVDTVKQITPQGPGGYRFPGNFRLTPGAGPGRLWRTEWYRGIPGQVRSRGVARSRRDRATALDETESGIAMDEIDGSGSEHRRTGRTIALLVAALLAASCGGEDTFLLTVFNTLDSTESIRVDLAGDTRELGIGDYTDFRSVTAGTHILSVDSPTCSGVVRDTLEVTADTVYRYRAERDANTGACEIVSMADVFRSVTPTGP